MPRRRIHPLSTSDTRHEPQFPDQVNETILSQNQKRTILTISMEYIRQHGLD
jgi:hypothetical protein